MKVGDYVYFLEEDTPEGWNSYLTPGKRYQITHSTEKGTFKGMYIPDLKHIIHIRKYGCKHLKGGNWRVLSYEEELRKLLE